MEIVGRMSAACCCQPRCHCHADVLLTTSLIRAGLSRGDLSWIIAEAWPPWLNKLIYALTAYLTRFDGTFMFEQIGVSLGEHEDQVLFLQMPSAAFCCILFFFCTCEV